MTNLLLFISDQIILLSGFRPDIEMVGYPARPDIQTYPRARSSVFSHSFISFPRSSFFSLTITFVSHAQLFFLTLICFFTCFLFLSLFLCLDMKSTLTINTQSLSPRSSFFFSHYYFCFPRSAVFSHTFRFFHMLLVFILIFVFRYEVNYHHQYSKPLPGGGGVRMSPGYFTGN